MNQTRLNTRGFYVATSVSWLSGLTGVALLYYAGGSDLLFLSGLSCLTFGAALSGTARLALSSAVARWLSRWGMGREQAEERAEQVVAELLLEGVNARDPRP